MSDQPTKSVTRAINSEIGTALARVAMFLALPAITLLGFLVHDWVTQPVISLAARVSLAEAADSAMLINQHQDELTITALSTSMSVGRQDRITATEDTKSALSALNAKTDQMQSSISTISSTLAGVAATLDVMKEHNVASLPSRP